MIVNNGAADLGGGITLDDSSNVRDRQQHGREQRLDRSAEDSDGLPHSRRVSPPRQTARSSRPTLPAERARLLEPVAFFNNIFWQNEAFTLSQPGPGATLVSNGFIDLEVQRDRERGRHAHARATRS